jgi:quercetin dioxygenase-like cupin family protein
MAESELNEPTSARKRLTIFRSQDATPVQDHMPVLGVDAGVMAGIEILNRANPTQDPNNGAQTVLLFREPGQAGMSLAYIWFKSGYILPRHTHDTDCLYYVLAGELHLGSRVLQKGDGMFIPANAGYTYQAGPRGVEVLEFRNATQFSFFFKNNTEQHWRRIADVLRNNSQQWQSELPPSERQEPQKHR